MTRFRVASENPPVHPHHLTASLCGGPRQLPFARRASPVTATSAWTVPGAPRVLVDSPVDRVPAGLLRPIGPAPSLGREAPGAFTGSPPEIGGRSCDDEGWQETLEARGPYAAHKRQTGACQASQRPSLSSWLLSHSGTAASEDQTGGPQAAGPQGLAQVRDLQQNRPLVNGSRRF